MLIKFLRVTLIAMWLIVEEATDQAKFFLARRENLSTQKKMPRKGVK